MRIATLVLGTLLATVTFASNAAYTTIDYTGVVSRVRAATYGPDGPADIQVGTPVSFSVTFDTSHFIQFRSHFTDQATGAPVYLDTGGYSLYNDPIAAYTITVASHTFTLADDDYHGVINEVGVGPFPLVSYADGHFLGVEADADVNGFHLAVSPGQFMLEEHRHVAYGSFDADGDYFFAVDTSLDPGIVAARMEGLAAAVPEPSSWALMLVGAAGLIARRRLTETARGG